MSHGISRNEAVKIAAEYNSRNVPYKTAYVSNKLTLSFMDLGKSFAPVTAAFNSLSSSFYRATNRIGRC
jgi:hypothetical protein